MRSIALSALSVLVLGLGVVACGGESLTTEEQLVVAEARTAFANTVLDSGMYAETLDGVDRLIALYRAKPEAKYDDLTMRQVVIDAANTLRDYRPELAAKLELALKDQP